MIPRLLIVVAALVGLLAVVVPNVPQPTLDWEGSIVPMAQRFAGVSSDNERPLEGKVVVITGATSGIGRSLTKMLSRLGATVVALGRSPNKLQALQDETLSPHSPPVQTVQADLVDLASVAQAAQQISETHAVIDVLVNNAGIHDGFSNLLGKFQSKQGYDKVFGTNYLSHFLLTEKLAPNLQKAKNSVVLQISSSYHWVVDGSDLLPRGKAPPIASVKGGSPGPNFGQFLFRSTRSYANSKLAQILHARALQRHHPLLANNTRIVSACPAWVNTNIAKEELFQQILAALAYDVDGWGMASILLAIFDVSSLGSETDHDFYSNTILFEYAGYVMMGQTNWMYRVGIRDVLGFILAFSVLSAEKWFPSAKVVASSPESYNEELGDALYQWSMSAVAPFL